MDISDWTATLTLEAGVLLLAAFPSVEQVTVAALESVGPRVAEGTGTAIVTFWLAPATRLAQLQVTL